MTSPFRTAIVVLVASFLLRTPVVAGDTSWMLDAKYGVFMHYQHRILLGYSHGTAALGTKARLPPPSEMTAEGWNRFVDGFDVQRFADRYKDKAAGWWFDAVMPDSYRERPHDWWAIKSVVHAANPKGVIAFSWGRNRQACM